MEAVFNLEEDEEETQSGSSQTSQRQPAQRRLSQTTNSATSLGSDVTGASGDTGEGYVAIIATCIKVSLGIELPKDFSRQTFSYFSLIY